MGRARQRAATSASTSPRSTEAAASVCARSPAVGEEISAAGCALLLIVVSPAIVGSILAKHGTPEQKDRWLRGIGAGTTKVAFAITEPDAGTNSHNLATTVERDGGRYLLNGQKTYISGVEDADAVLVVARFRNEDGSLGLPSPVIVDVDAPGFTRTQIPMPCIGPDHQWQLFFDDVEVDEDRLIGGENGGLGAIFDGLNPERIMGAAIGQRRRSVRARQGAATTPASATSGASRSAPTRGSRTRWPRRRSSSSSPA